MIRTAPLAKSLEWRVAVPEDVHQPWPYPIEGDEYGDVEYALRRAEWEGD